MTRLPRSQPRDERGQAALEMAMAMPLLAVFILGIVAAGWTVYVHLDTLTSAYACTQTGAMASARDDYLAFYEGARVADLVVKSHNGPGVKQYLGQRNVIGSANTYTCLVGIPAEEHLVNRWMKLPRLQFGGYRGETFAIRYDFLLPVQEFRSASLLWGESVAAGDDDP